MGKVKVYQFTKYDIRDDENHTSRRWATREAIERIGWKVLEHTAIDVDASVLNSDGMTVTDFDPHRHAGFQRQVCP